MRHDLTFLDAANEWLTAHSLYIKERTVHDYRQYIKALTPFFGEMRLDTITIDRVREYQKQRQAGATRINMEMSTLQQVMKEAGVWEPLQPLYRPLPVSPKGRGQSLTEEQTKLFEIAFSRPRRRLAAHCLRVMYNTGTGFGELRHVRRCDVDLKRATVSIGASGAGAKNLHRMRTIPLIPEALESMQWLIYRWEGLGGREPEQFILPHCSEDRDGPRDFYRPMGSIKKAWAGIRREAIEQIGPHVATLRIYDARVTCVTRVLLNGASPTAAERLFGHVSQRMQARYFQPHVDELRQALAPLDGTKKPGIAEAVENGLDRARQSIGLSVAKLIERLKSVGMPAEKILEVITGLDG